MARLTILFLVLAVVATLFGFGDIDERIAKAANYVALGCILIFMITLLLRGVNDRSGKRSKN